MYNQISSFPIWMSGTFFKNLKFIPMFSRLLLMFQSKSIFITSVMAWFLDVLLWLTPYRVNEYLHNHQVSSSLVLIVMNPMTNFQSITLIPISSHSQSQVTLTIPDKQNFFVLAQNSALLKYLTMLWQKSQFPPIFFTFLSSMRLLYGSQQPEGAAESVQGISHDCNIMYAARGGPSMDPGGYTGLDSTASAACPPSRALLRVRQAAHSICGPSRGLLQTGSNA